jgi:hypothetical protein
LFKQLVTIDTKLEVNVKTVALCLFLITIIAALFSGCSATTTAIADSRYKINVPHSKGLVQSISFSLETPLTDIPDKAPIYKMVQPEINEKYVAGLGVKFGLTGKVTQGSENFLITSEEDDTNLMVFKATGTIHYLSPSKVYPKETPVLPSDEEALKIASNFLTERELLPEGRVAYKVDVGGKVNGSPAHLLVSFTSSIHATGPGARMGVRIGNKGEVVEVFINPTNPGTLPIQETAILKPVQQALQELENAKNYYAPPDTKVVKIKEVGIAYWLEGIEKGQDYIVPVYTFKGDCWDSSNEQLSGGFSEVAEAIK